MDDPDGTVQRFYMGLPSLGEVEVKSRVSTLWEYATEPWSNRAVMV